MSRALDLVILLLLLVAIIASVSAVSSFAAVSLAASFRLVPQSIEQSLTWMVLLAILGLIVAWVASVIAWHCRAVDIRLARVLLGMVTLLAIGVLGTVKSQNLALWADLHEHMLRVRGSGTLADLQRDLTDGGFGWATLEKPSDSTHHILVHPVDAERSSRAAAWLRERGWQVDVQASK